MKEKTKLKKNGGEGTGVGNALRWLAKQGKTIAPGILDIAGDLTGIGALDKLGQAISGDKELSEADKQLLLGEIELDKIREQEITKRWEADLHSDSWLSKNIRPMTLGWLLLNMSIFVALDGSGVLSIKDVWVEMLGTLLATAIGGYFVIRGGEKIMNKYKSGK
jgi:hypothetical protein